MANMTNMKIINNCFIVKPSHVRITQLTPILVAGNDALFECNTYGSRPMPIIYWLFDGNRYDTRIHGK